VLECWYKYHRVRTVANAALDSYTVGQKPHKGAVPAPHNICEFPTVPSSATSPSEQPSGKIVAVIGATASGKSELALKLAETFNGEIITTDSLQVYRHLDIGTAKPDKAQQARAPHHLLDRVKPDQPYSAAAYAADGAAIIAKLQGAGRLPILCGGTGLYFRALLFGLAEVPEIPAEVRSQVMALRNTGGQAACRAELERLDPPGAVALHPNDSARTMRALEVLLATGKPLRIYQRKKPPPLRAGNVLSVGLARERVELYGRINRRVDQMLEMGWVEEVRDIFGMGYSPALKPLQSIGYREIGELLQGHRNEDGLAADISQRTRHYAKRQLTWFRKHPGTFWAGPEDLGKITRRVQIFLKTGK
jgi:tRNA dimethylallyltransferase